MFDFDKLFLVRDSEYGTHVTYINEYPYHIFLDFFTDSDNLYEILNEIEFFIEKEKEKED